MSGQLGVVFEDPVKGLSVEGVEVAVIRAANSRVSGFFCDEGDLTKEVAFRESGINLRAIIRDHLHDSSINKIHFIAHFASSHNDVVGGEDNGFQGDGNLADEVLSNIGEDGDFFNDAAIDEEEQLGSEAGGQVVDDSALIVGHAALPEVFVVASNAHLEGVRDAPVFEEGVDFFHFLGVLRLGDVEVGDEAGDATNNVAIHGGAEDHDEHGEEGLGVGLGRDIAVANGSEGREDVIERFQVLRVLIVVLAAASEGNPAAGEPVPGEGGPKEEEHQSEQSGVHAGEELGGALHEVGEASEAKQSDESEEAKARGQGEAEVLNKEDGQGGQDVDDEEAP